MCIFNDKSPASYYCQIQNENLQDDAVYVTIVIDVYIKRYSDLVYTYAGTGFFASNDTRCHGFEVKALLQNNLLFSIYVTES